MSSLGTNVHLYGAQNGNPASVTTGGNLGAQLDYDLVYNVGRLILRSGTVTRLQDIPCVMVIVYSPDTNHNVWYAGYNAQVPDVGVGACIPPGTVEEIECTNANLLSFTPTTDGNEIYVTVLGNNSPAVVIPSDPPAFSNAPITLTPIQPASNNATGVSISSPIIVQASVPVEGATVNNTTVTCTPTMTATIAQAAEDATKIVVTPTVNLSNNTQYTITYHKGILDGWGNTFANDLTLTFTTAVLPPPPDTTPPTIVSANPGSGTSNVNPSTVPSVTFSKPMNAASFNATNITAFLTANNQPIPNLSFSLSTDLTTLYVGNMNLTTSTNYSIVIHGGNGVGPTDLPGNYLQAATTTITFATAPPAQRIIYSVTGNDYVNMYSSSYTWVGLNISSNRSLLVGQTPVGYTFILNKVGNPTGTVYFRWYRGSGGGYYGGITYTKLREMGSIAASSITTADQLITITDTGNTNKIQYNDTIGVEYLNAGSSSNYIRVKISNYDAFDGTNTELAKVVQNGEINFYDTADLAGTISVAGS